MWGPCGKGAMMGKMMSMMGKGYGANPYEGYGSYGKGAPKGGGGGGGGGGDDDAEDYGGGGGGRKKRSGGGGSPGWYVDGFPEALDEAFSQAGVADTETDMDALKEKIQNLAYKQTKKFYNDERMNQKMTSAQARSLVEEFVEAVMGSFSNAFSDKPWFEKVGWDSALLMLTFHTFGTGKIFTRTMKTEIAEFIQTGIVHWYEEEKLVKGCWDALGEAGFSEAQKKKANQHLMKAYDQAHFSAPFGETSNASPEVAELQDFVKGWMTEFAQKAYSAIETVDSSPDGQCRALTTIFQHLCDPNVAALPLKLQSCIMPSPWSYLEECANEVISEIHQESPAKKPRLGM